FRHLVSQCGKIADFGFRICKRLLSKVSRRRIILDCYELLLDSSRKTCSGIYEQIQCCACEGRRCQAKENDAKYSVAQRLWSVFSESLGHLVRRLRTAELHDLPKR